MKIALYHPNLHFMGGGETVALTIASALREEHEVTVFCTKAVPQEKLESFFGLPLQGVTFKVFGKAITKLPSFSSFKPSLYLRSLMPVLNRFDVVIDTCSNGLFYKKLQAKTICYVHFPNYTVRKHGIKALLNGLLIKEEEMFTYDKILCNSEFTKRQVVKLTKRKLDVLYPPVEVEEIHPKKKDPIIASIGRFSPEKKFEALVEAFIHLENVVPEFTLHLIGAYRDEADREYFAKLKRQAKGHRIVFHKNMPHAQVLAFLEKTKIYWHARGFGETDPVEYENFGITTVEAMAAGCIPIVINLGAQPEIVQDGKNGFTWNTIEELVEKTASALYNPTASDYEVSLFSKNYFLNGIAGVIKR